MAALHEPVQNTPVNDADDCILMSRRVVLPEQIGCIDVASTDESNLEMWAKLDSLVSRWEAPIALAALPLGAALRRIDAAQHFRPESDKAMRFVSFPLLVILAVLHFPTMDGISVNGDDWPQWRGPNRDGIWREAGVIDAIPASGLPVKWRTRILNGWSGPAVSAGRVFVTDHDYRSDPEVERVLCFDEKTGRPLWQHKYPCPYGNMEYGNGPRATPTVHEGLVYALGTMGHLVCLDAETGALRWTKDPVRDLNARIPRYGVSAAPLLEGEVVIISAGARPNGTAIAFDRKTGTERWRALADRPAYSAPIVLDAGGKRQVILWTGDNVNSLDPTTGALLWQVPFKALFDPAQATATPVVYKDKLFCLAAWNRGSMMLKLDQNEVGASVFWKTDSNPTASTSTPVFQDDDSIYTIVGDGALCRVDPATGDEIWRTREATSEHFGMAHIVTNGDRSFLLNQQGHLIVARLTPGGYHELGRMPLVEPTAGYRPAGAVCWAHPAFANKHIFARNDRELVCVSLSTEAATTGLRAETSRLRSTVLPETSGADVNQTLSVTVSPNGKTVALGTGWGLVRQVDLLTGTQSPCVKRHNDWVCAVSYSPDGMYLASAGGSEFTPERNGGTTSAEMKVWDREAGSERGKLEGHTNKIFSAVFSPVGHTLATGAADRTIRLWDIDAMRERLILRGHSDAISSLSWSGDGRMLASASWDKTVRLWEIGTGKELATLSGSDEEILCVAISPNAEWVAAGGSDWNVRLWEISSGRSVAVLSGHRGIVYTVAFSPDGKTMATGSGDETIRLWNLESRRSTATLSGHSSGVTSLAFTPDGRQLVSGASNGPVRVWNLVP
jgi:WD40 repeat protein